VKIATPVKYSQGADGNRLKTSSVEDNTRQRSSLFSGNTPRKRPSKNAAVTIRTNPDGPSYAEVIRQAREGVNLKELGITNPRMRRAANGGILIEIPDSEGTMKTDALASRLCEVIGQNAVVARPGVMADVRVSGFDESVTKDELIAVLTEIGGSSDIRVSPFRPIRNGLTWIRCPLVSAIKLVRKSKLNIGWFVACVEMMRSRPVQCYKCWNFGHVHNQCSSDIDRTNHCFKCGNPNHTSYSCLSDAYCVICADLGHDTTHRIGSTACASTARAANSKSSLQ